MIISGIGSRKTPSNILTSMTCIGQWCRDHGIYVFSGHADGADYAFEKGAQENCVTFLPWKGFNSKLESFGTQYIHNPGSDRKYSSSYADALVDKYHPNPSRLSRGARLLMARNSYQVLGPTMQIPVSAVVCWTHGGKIAGGSGQAMRIATAYKIPIYNLYSMSCGDVITKLDNLLKGESHGS